MIDFLHFHTFQIFQNNRLFFMFCNSLTIAHSLFR